MQQQFILQLAIAFFGLFALSRVYLRFKERKLSSLSFIFWLGIWFFGVLAVFDPNITTYIANFLGIGRGVDIVIYTSIGVIFYLIFRVYIKIEDTERRITELTRKIALSNLYKIKKTTRKKSK